MNIRIPGSLVCSLADFFLWYCCSVSLCCASLYFSTHSPHFDILWLISPPLSRSVRQGGHMKCSLHSIHRCLMIWTVIAGRKSSSIILVAQSKLVQYVYPAMFWKKQHCNSSAPPPPNIIIRTQFWWCPFDQYLIVVTMSVWMTPFPHIINNKIFIT